MQATKYRSRSRRQTKAAQTRYHRLSRLVGQRAAGDVIQGTALDILIIIGSVPNPSVRYLMARCGMSSPNAVMEVLRRLRKIGLVTWEPGQKRTLRPTFKFFVPE